MQIFLELSGHPKANIKRLALAGTTIVGRSKTCGLQIASSSVSRKHCEIRVGDEAASVIDLGSSNGTFVGSERIAAGEEHSLPEGIRLNIGGVRFLVSYVDPRAAREVPAADSTANANAGQRTEESLATAAAAPVAEESLASDEEPLALDDDDDLLGFAEAESDQQTAESELGEPAATEAAIDEDEIPLAADEDEILASEESPQEEPILGGDSLLLTDDEEPLLVDDSSETIEAAGEKDIPPVATEPNASSEKAAEVPEPDEESFEEFEDEEASTHSAGAEDEILGDWDDNAPILAFDESDEPLADETASESDIHFEDSTPHEAGAGSLNGKAPNGRPADPTMPAMDVASEETFEEDTDEEDADEEDHFEEDSDDEESEALADEEPILEDDEDEAFAFLNDDDDHSKPKSHKNDSELGDFLSQLGRD